MAPLAANLYSLAHVAHYGRKLLYYVSYSIRCRR